MRLHDYVNEIFDIAAKHRVAPANGATMFLSNCSRAEDYYVGSTGVDWADLSDNVAELRSSMFTFYKAINDNMDQIKSLREAGDFEGAKSLVVNYN